MSQLITCLRGRQSGSNVSDVDNLESIDGALGSGTLGSIQSTCPMALNIRCVGLLPVIMFPETEPNEALAFNIQRPVISIIDRPSQAHLALRLT